MKRFCLVLLGLLCVILAGGCNAAEEAETAGEGVYQIYYLNSSGTKLVSRNYIPEQTEDMGALIEELMIQFLQVPADLDCQTALGEKVEFQKYAVDNNVLYLYFDANYMLMDSTREILCRAALVKLFTQIEGIEYINIYSGDQPIMDSSGTPVGMLTAGDFVESISDVNTFEQSQLVLYFADETGEKLVREKREVIHSINTSTERLIVEQLIEGPHTEGLYATLPPETKILNISVMDSVCYINFDQAFLNNSLSVKEYIPIYSVVNSLTETGGVSRVQFAVNGSQDVLFKDIVSLKTLFEQNLEYVEQ